MKFFFFLILTAFSLQADAQSRYCKSYEDYKSDNWTELPSIVFKQYSHSKQLWTRKHEYRFTTGNKKTDRKLREEAFVIQKGDSLFVNLSQMRCENVLFGKGFAYGMPLIGKKILFISNRVDLKSSSRQTNNYVAFGLMGAMIAKSSNIKIKACYILDTNPNGHYTDVLLIDDEVMRKLLADDKALLDRYFMVEDQYERESPPNILPLLRAKGLIE